MSSRPEQGRSLAPGDVVAARYLIVRLLGQGGMGSVYEAKHTALGRMVALKTLLPSLAKTPEATARFVREAQSAASIRHPGIVQVFDLGVDDGVVFIAMEKLEGEELHDRIARSHPLGIEPVIRIGLDIADAIAAAHDHGIVHRDLKPQNIFLCSEGRREDVVKILDFGIAKLTQGDGAGPLTKTGQIYGTPVYMSTEQIQGVKDLDGRADLYAIGAILREALTGAPPYSADTYAELVFKIIQSEPASLKSLRPDVPQELVDIIEKSMHKDREQRFRTAREMVAALQTLHKKLSAEVPHGSAPTMQAFTLPGPAVAEPARPSSPAPTPAPHAAAEQAPVRSWNKLLLGAGLGVVIVTAAGLLLMPSAENEPTQDDPQVQAPESESESESASETTPESAEPAQPEATEQPSSVGAGDESAMRRVRFDVSPAGASVQVDGRYICNAPCEAELPDTETELVVALPGYVPQQRTLTPPLPESLELELTRQRPSSMMRPRPRPSSDEPPPLLPR